MTDRNPYEKNDDVDIPFFSSKNDETGEDIDRSVFDTDDEDEDYEEEYYDDEPRYRKVKEPIVIVSIILMIVLLAVAIAGILFGVNKKKAYDTLKADYDQFVTKANATESSLNAQIAELKKQIADITNGGSDQSGQSTEDGSTYKVVATGGLAVRTGASATNGFADYEKLPDDIKKNCDANDGSVYINSGATFKVLETKTENYSEGTRVWGRVADNAWICLKTNNDDYCVKQ